MPYKKANLKFFKLNAKSLPNYLTILRLILIPIIFALILTSNYSIGFIMFVIAIITDFLDGQIARRFNLITEWGSLMDPLADKLTQISTIAALVITDVIPFWILIILTIKEITMICVSFNLYNKNIVTVHSKWYGKAATILFFIAIMLSLLSKEFTFLTNMVLYVYDIAIIMTLFAAVMYGKYFIFRPKKNKSESLLP